MSNALDFIPNPQLGNQVDKNDASAAPTANSDAANTDGNGFFAAGSRWVDVVANISYVCVDASTGAAIWNELTFAGGTAAVSTLIATVSVTAGTLLLSSGSITDSGGSIAFASANLSTTGTLGAGAITTGGDLLFTQANPKIFGGDVNGAITIGPSGSGKGGMLKLYGESHATQANDIELLSGNGAVALHYDYSTTTFDFGSNSISAPNLSGSNTGDQATNLTVTRSGTLFTLESSTGSNINLPAADTTNWGLMTDEMYDTLQAASSYTHPTYLGDDFTLDTAPMTGATIISDLDINITTDTEGHVVDANGVVATRTLTLADLGFTGSANANEYTHPTNTTTNQNGSLASIIDQISTDSGGHVTALTSRTLTLADLGYAGSPTANEYIHPTSYLGDDFSIDTGALTGATVISDIDINVTTDTLGHTVDANASVATRVLTLANLGYTGATNADVTSANTCNSPNVVQTTVTGNAGNVTGTVAIGNGGTGATTQSAARTALGVDAAGYISLNATTSTHTSCFIPFVRTASGTAQIVEVDSAQLLYNAGTGTVTSVDYTITSDARKKKNVLPLPLNDAWFTVNGLEAITHEWNDGVGAKGRFDGFIAQQAQLVAPHLVTVGDDEDETLSMAYQKLVVAHNKVLQDIGERLAMLEAK